MANSTQFPNNANGDVLRQMEASGDDLTKARCIDFYFTFPERKQSLSFANIINDRGIEVCISYYEQRGMWQVIVKCYMVPSYEDVTSLEILLTQKAESVGGEADGWGSMQVDSPD